MSDMNLSGEQVRILIAELGDTRDHLGQVERLLVGAGTPGGDVIKSVQMIIEQRDNLRGNYPDEIEAALAEMDDSGVSITLDRAGIEMRNTVSERVQLLADERDHQKQSNDEFKQRAGVCDYLKSDNFLADTYQITISPEFEKVTLHLPPKCPALIERF